MDVQLRKIHESVEMLVLNRRDLACYKSAFSKSSALLSNCEEHTNLSRALAQLAEVKEKVIIIYFYKFNNFKFHDSILD